MLQLSVDGDGDESARLRDVGPHAASSQGASQDTSRDSSQGASQGESQGRSQGASQGQSQDTTPGAPQGKSQDTTPGASQGQSQDGSQCASQSPALRLGSGLLPPSSTGAGAQETTQEREEERGEEWEGREGREEREGGWEGREGPDRDPELASPGYTIEEAMDAIGFGRVQIFLVVYTGMVWLADAMEMILLSFVGPAAHCAFGLTPTQEGLISSVVFLGVFLGSYVWGFVADTRGRRVGFMLPASFLLCFGVLSAGAPSYALLLLSRMMVGVGIGGAAVVFSLCSEFLPSSSREFWLVAIEFFWTVGTLMEATLAWAVMPHLHWRVLVLVSAAPLLLLLLAFPLLPESPRFLLLQGDLEGAQRILTLAARINGRALPPGRLILACHRCHREWGGEAGHKGPCGAEHDRKHFGSCGGEQDCCPISSSGGNEAGSTGPYRVHQGSCGPKHEDRHAETSGVQSTAAPSSPPRPDETGTPEIGHAQGVAYPLSNRPEPLPSQGSDQGGVGVLCRGEGGDGDERAGLLATGSAEEATPGYTGGVLGCTKGTPGGAPRGRSGELRGSIERKVKELLTPPLLRSTLVVWLLFFASAFSYYGLVLLTTQLAEEGAGSGAPGAHRCPTMGYTHSGPGGGGGGGGLYSGGFQNGSYSDATVPRSAPYSDASVGSGSGSSGSSSRSSSSSSSSNDSSFSSGASNSSSGSGSSSPGNASEGFPQSSPNEEDEASPSREDGESSWQEGRQGREQQPGSRQRQPGSGERQPGNQEPQPDSLQRQPGSWDLGEQVPGRSLAAELSTPGIPNGVPTSAPGSVPRGGVLDSLARGMVPFWARRLSGVGEPRVCLPDGSPNIGGEVYLDVFVTSCAELPGLVVALALVGRFGSKFALWVLLLAAGAFLLPLARPLPEVPTTLMLFAARAAISGSFSLLWAYTPEVYPTQVRSTGLSIANSWGRLGGFLCPFVAVSLLQSCRRELAVGLFVAIPVIAAVITAIFAEETKGHDLREFEAEASAVQGEAQDAKPLLREQ